jgi:hypothetical protein
MSTPIMIYSRLNGNVIDIRENSTQSGAGLDAFPSKTHLNLTGNPEPLAANQTWEVLPNPAGPDHFIIQNPATGHCIDIDGNSTKRGASLDAWPAKNSDNQNQLWDALPDPFGSGYFFIQNPQTGYVIEIENGSSKAGASLVVNPRRLFDNKSQLWGGTEGPLTAGPGETGSGATFQALTLAQPTAVLKDTAQYVLLPKDQTKNLTGITATLDIIEDLVADSFSVQINGNPPYPAPKGAAWQWQLWMQFGLFMQNNGLFLFTQVFPRGKPPFPGPLLTPSVQQSSPRSMLQLQNNTVPAGTQIVLTLTTDSKNNDYVTGVSGKVYDKSGSPIGTPDSWSAIGQPTWTSNGPGAQPNGPPVQESDLAPLGAFQVVVVGNPDEGGHAHFTSGMGTITVTCTPDISAQLFWPSPAGAGTAETSNCYYGKVQEGYFPQIAQPFGLPRPKITGVLGETFTGTGLLPNSKLSVSAAFTNGEGPPAAEGDVYNSGGLVSQNDGSFSVMVEPPNTGIAYTTLSTTVYDADKNWAAGVVPTSGPPGNLTSTSGLSP